MGSAWIITWMDSPVTAFKLSRVIAKYISKVALKKKIAMVGKKKIGKLKIYGPKSHHCHQAKT